MYPVKRHVRNGQGTVRPYVCGSPSLLDFVERTFGGEVIEHSPDGGEVEPWTLRPLQREQAAQGIVQALRSLRRPSVAPSRPPSSAVVRRPWAAAIRTAGSRPSLRKA